jgi:hypothetical protein
MRILVPPDVEAVLVERAHRLRTTPADLAVDSLRRSLSEAAGHEVEALADSEWEARLRALAIDCDVSPGDEAFAAESLYD